MDLQLERWSETAPPDPAVLRKQMESEGYTVFQWVDEPGTKYGPHAHDEDQTHWIISGELELRIGYESYTLGTGDRDFLAANTMHSASVPEKAAVTYLIGKKY